MCPPEASTVRPLGAYVLNHLVSCIITKYNNIPLGMMSLGSIVSPPPAAMAAASRAAMTAAFDEQSSSERRGHQAKKLSSSHTKKQWVIEASMFH